MEPLQCFPKTKNSWKIENVVSPSSEGVVWTAGSLCLPEIMLEYVLKRFCIILFGFSSRLNDFSIIFAWSPLSHLGWFEKSALFWKETTALKWRYLEAQTDSEFVPHWKSNLSKRAIRWAQKPGCAGKFWTQNFYSKKTLREFGGLWRSP